MRGDTLFIEHFDTRYPYCFQVVEFIANDTLPQNIHIWRYPKSCNNWYYHQKYKTTNLSIKILSENQNWSVHINVDGN